MDLSQLLQTASPAATVEPYSKSYLDSLSGAMLAFSIITTILIITISIPQLIKIVKEKKTGEVSLTSFWIFQYGILFWVIYAAFNPGVAYKDAAGNMTLSGYLPTLVGETITIVINGVVLFLLHYYKPGIAKWKIWLAAGFILLNWAISIIVFIVHFTTHQCYVIDLNGQQKTVAETTVYNGGKTGSQTITYLKWNGKVYVPNGTTVTATKTTPQTIYIPRFPAIASLVLGLIGPAGVTLPFTPQLIKSFKTHEWQGVSIWLFVLYTINNAAWLIFFSVAIRDQICLAANSGVKLGNAYYGFVGGLAWQCVGSVLFAIQLAFTADDMIKRKKGLRPDQLVQKPIENEMLIE